MRRGGPKKNIVDVDFGDRIRIEGMDEAALRARVENYIKKDELLSQFVDMFVLHADVKGKPVQIVVEVGQ